MLNSGQSKLQLVCYFVFLACIYIQAVIANPQLQFIVETEPQSKDFGSVELIGIAPDLLATLRAKNIDLKEWQRMFAVKSQQQDLNSDINQIPNVAGRYEILESSVRFIPMFAPSPGLTYSISTKLEGHEIKSEVIVLSKASLTGNAKTKVDKVYPSANIIPENTLRLYVHFSAPIRRGQVSKHINILDESGKVIKNAFIFGPLGELWDNSQRRLTLLLDPGRIKQGVGPNRKFGPALKVGRQTTLFIDHRIKDANGNELGIDFRKTYEVSEASRKAISPEQWKISAPKSGSTSPLIIQFSRALDSAMLMHSIRIYDVKGSKISGQVYLNANETEWLFEPTKTWSSKKHIIEIASNLEDVSGNNTHAPFDDVQNTPSPNIAQSKLSAYLKRTFTPQ